jgi:3-oxoacyl-[acyl-carrier-protein] synthase II
MEAYIRATAAISPQESFNNGLFKSDVTEHQTPWMKCIEPDYKEIINPALIRRMSRIVKMGVASAMRCMNDAGVANPDAIITGTGLGCLDDTGNFLSSMIKNKEQFLTPTAFIQSTHNTISGQIALMIKCNNYNFAYVHRGFSFESALLDAMMMLEEGETHHILLGGIDEVTQDYWNITSRLGLWKRKQTGNLSLLNDKNSGSIAGEGSAFFMLNKDSEGSAAKFKGVEMIYKPASNDELVIRTHEMLEKAGVNINDIDAVFMGYNGWPRYDRLYKPLTESVFLGKPIIAFKHLCGEYMTASSFAAWLASEIIKQQTLPESLLVASPKPSQLRNILICNHFMGIDYTLMLLSAC